MSSPNATTPPANQPAAGTSEPRERRISLTDMLGRRTSIDEAYKKYNAFTINGDGFKREDYMKPVEPEPPKKE